MDKEIKKTIRALRKLKRQTQVGSPDRRDINRKIRELKTQINIVKTPEKDTLVKEISELEPQHAKLGINLYKFTVEELAFHLKKIKEELK